MTQNEAIVAALMQLVAGGQKAQKSAGKVTKKSNAKKKAGGREKLSEAEKAVYAAQNDAECVAIFTKAGYKDVQPRVNVMTYKRWVAAGRLVRKGEKAIRVGPFNLFHIDQCDPLPVTGQNAPSPTVEAPQTVQ